MFVFCVIFAVSVLALLLVQGFDVECANQPKPRRPNIVKQPNKPEAVRQAAKHVYESALSSVR